MRTALRTISLVLLIAFLAACNLPSGEGGSTVDQIATEVARTLAAFTPGGAETPVVVGDTPVPGQPTLTLAPTLTFTLEPTLTPQITATPKPGAIGGSVYGYPWGSLPALTMVAFNQDNSSYWWWIVGAGQSYFETNMFITPGRYLVVAYDADGHSGSCPTVVTVTAEQTANCDVSSWGGGNPARPGSVPLP